MKISLKLAATFLALAIAMPLLSACNTTAGIGKDVSAGGHALTNSAEKAKP